MFNYAIGDGCFEHIQTSGISSHIHLCSPCFLCVCVCLCFCVCCEDSLTQCRPSLKNLINGEVPKFAFNFNYHGNKNFKAIFAAADAFIVEKAGSHQTIQFTLANKSHPNVQNEFFKHCDALSHIKCDHISAHAHSYSRSAGGVV